MSGPDTRDQKRQEIGRQPCQNEFTHIHRPQNISVDLSDTRLEAWRPEIIHGNLKERLERVSEAGNEELGTKIDEKAGA